jgi:predicted dehydrogenase
VAVLDAHRPRLEVWSDEPPWLPPRRDPEDPMGFWRSTSTRLGVPPKRGWVLPEGDPPALADARAFLDCLERGVSSEVDAVAGAAAVEALMACYESAATGLTVQIPL